MNKYVFCILILAVLGCRDIPVQNAIKIEQIENTYPIIIRVSDVTKEITKINVPITFFLKNTSFEERSFSDATYLYRKRHRGGGSSPLYTIDKGVMSLVKNKKERFISAKSKKKFLVYSSHYPDTTKRMKSLLRPVLKQMMSSNKDTLHISMRNFKNNDTKLIYTLMLQDTLKIYFNDFKRTKYSVPIKIPIKI